MGKSILARSAMNMLSSGIQPQRTDIHPILPLYMVIATAFAGYGLMVAIFIPMLIHDTGFFDKSIPTATRAIYGGILLALYPLGQSLVLLLSALLLTNSEGNEYLLYRLYSQYFST